MAAPTPTPKKKMKGFIQMLRSKSTKDKWEGCFFKNAYLGSEYDLKTIRISKNGINKGFFSGSILADLTGNTACSPLSLFDFCRDNILQCVYNFMENREQKEKINIIDSLDDWGVGRKLLCTLGLVKNMLMRKPSYFGILKSVSGYKKFTFQTAQGKHGHSFGWVEILIEFTCGKISKILVPRWSHRNRYRVTDFFDVNISPSENCPHIIGCFPEK